MDAIVKSCINHATLHEAEFISAFFTVRDSADRAGSNTTAVATFVMQSTY